MVRAIRVLYNGSQEEARNSKAKPKPAAPAMSQATKVTPNRTVIKLRHKKSRRKGGGSSRQLTEFEKKKYADSSEKRN